MSEFLGVVLLIAFGFVLGLITGVEEFQSVESDIKLEPKLIITKQGIKSDTLYVYKKK